MGNNDSPSPTTAVSSPLADGPDLIHELRERDELFERLTKILRSISHRAPLQEVLDAITRGANELIGDEVAGLRLLDPNDSKFVILVSVTGLKPELIPALERGPVGEGAGGRAIGEERLVIIQDYESEPTSIPVLAQDHLRAAMAAPVYENGVIAGSLVVASYQTGRRYSKLEQEALMAFAEHASLALTDAKSLEAIREAQRSKEMFFAMASHELKTPLTVIMGTLRTLERHGSQVSEGLRSEMIRAAYERGEQLEALINRLLQGARSELAGARHTVPIQELVSGAISGFDQSREVRVGEIPEGSVQVDRTALTDIIGIFLENAVSHSPAGTAVTVSVTIDGREIGFAVTNEGSLPEDLDHNELFMPFLRSTLVASPGVGLGLYIAARIASSMGGRIEVQNEGGRITFCLKLRLERTIDTLEPVPAN